MAKPTIGDLVDLLTDDTNSAGRRRAGLAMLRQVARADLLQPKDPDTPADLTVPASDDDIGLALLVVAGELVVDVADALETIAAHAGDTTTPSGQPATRRRTTVR